MKVSRRAMLAGIIAVPAAAALVWPASADAGAIYSYDGIAVDGSDVVSYFSEGMPVMGKPDFTYDWRDVTWLFSSAANRDLFAEDPERYAPQYGGFCAYAVSQGYTASTIPEAWKIVDGKLYLNYSRGVQRKWEKDISGYITAADMNWPDVLS